MTQLNQFYTEEIFSDRLIGTLKSDEPEFVLDLGFGAGGLLHAARRRWKNTNLIGIDIDVENILSARESRLIEALELNGFSSDIPNVIRDKFGSIDLLVSNPPYFSKDYDCEAKKILKLAGLNQCISNNLKKIPAELIFLAQNLRLLSEKGEIGIILPAGLISGERWVSLREFLFKEYFVSSVVQLPDNSFKKTEAQAFIMTISNLSKDREYSVDLSGMELEASLQVDIEQAIQRSDYQYYRQQNKQYSRCVIENRDFSIHRGQDTHKDLKIANHKFLHTTQLPNLPQRVKLADAPKKRALNARLGDIVLARVGRRCLGRAIYIEAGSLPVSDCIIVVRPRNEEVGMKLWEKISSPFAIKYLQQTSYGVGAKYITHKSVSDFLLKE